MGEKVGSFRFLAIAPAMSPRLEPTFYHPNHSTSYHSARNTNAAARMDATPSTSDASSNANALKAIVLVGGPNHGPRLFVHLGVGRGAPSICDLQTPLMP